MRYKLVIFDFDGTLADSFPWVLNILDRLADKYGFDRLDHSQIDAMRGHDPKTLMNMYRVPFWKLPMIGSDVRRWMNRDIDQIPLFEGIERLLGCLAQRGIQMAVVTSNAYENVRSVLGQHNAGLIRHYECGVSIFGKPPKLRKVLKEAGVHPAEAICIGDEIRDIQAAKQVGIPIGAVAWGYARPDALAARSPDVLFESVDDVLQHITG